MRNAVVIKSYQNGIAIYLDADLEFDRLLAEVALKFQESGHFFKDMKVAVSFEGRILTEEEERLLVQTIRNNSSLNIVCIVGKDPGTDTMFQKAVEEFQEGWDPDSSGHFYRGSLKNGEMLESESSIIIVGDVEPGACVVSTKDIVVLGALYGTAYAGGNGSSRHYIAALEMSPQKLKIGDFKYKAKEKSRWSLRTKKVQPQIAYVQEKCIVLEPITNELLNGLF